MKSYIKSTQTKTLKNTRLKSAMGNGLTQLVLEALAMCGRGFKITIWSTAWWPLWHAALPDN